MFASRSWNGIGLCDVTVMMRMLKVRKSRGITDDDGERGCREREIEMGGPGKERDGEMGKEADGE